MSVITNAEARDQYKQAYERADELYEEIGNKEEEFQNTITEKRILSEQLGEEINGLQGQLDKLYGFLDICKRIKDEEYIDEQNYIYETSTNFQAHITHSLSSIDIESYYFEYMKRIFKNVSDMIDTLNGIISELESKKTTLTNEKDASDETLRNAQKDQNNLESRSSILSQREESYQWYKYYLAKCDDEGEDADSGLY